MAKKDRREYNRQWYLAHRDSEIAKAKQWHQDHKEADRVNRTKYKYANRDLVNDVKKAGACVRCGIADWRVLEFHHIDPCQKKMNVNVAWRQSAGRQAILDEIAKCELICANCHKIPHWEERNGEASVLL